MGTVFSSKAKIAWFAHLWRPVFQHNFNTCKVDFSVYKFHVQITSFSVLQ